LLRADAALCPQDGTAPQVFESAPPGTMLGAYQIVRMLGEGGMGFVYEARQVELDRRVAIKMLRPELADNAQVVTRFLNEAKAANSIGHPNIVDITHYGDGGDGNVYFVMEFLVGEMLDDLMRRRVMQVPLFLHVFRQLGKALAAAHAKQIVHRDLKPANVYVVPREGNPAFIKLLDFGIAQLRGAGAVQGLTVAGSVMGTPQYMSPEQITGGTVDARTDVWALGAMMYRALTCQPPFPGDEFAELAGQILHSVPRPVGELIPMPASLSKLVMKCLERNVAARCQSIDEVLAGLEQVRREAKLDEQAIVVGAAHEIQLGKSIEGSGGPVAAMTNDKIGGSLPHNLVPPSWLPAIPAAPRKSKRGALLAAGAAVVLLGGGAVWFATKGKAEATEVAEEPTKPPAPGPTKEITPAPPGPQPEPPPEDCQAQRTIAAAFAAGDLEAVRSLANTCLRLVLRDGSLQEQGFAVDMLGEVRLPQTASLLYQALKGQPDIRVKAGKALADLKLPDAAPKVREALSTSAQKPKVELAAAMFRLGEKDAKPILLRALEEPSTKAMAAGALAEGNEAAGKAVLLETLEVMPAGNTQWQRAAGALVKLGDDAGKQALEGELSQKDSRRSVGAAELLAAAGDGKAKELLARNVADEEFPRRGQAAVALARLGDRRALAWVGVGLGSADDEERRQALAVCGALVGATKDHLGTVAKLASDDPDARVRMAAQAVLLGMEGT
jgi:eukaryotic-like serine/threonine-protein kinase